MIGLKQAKPIVSTFYTFRCISFCLYFEWPSPTTLRYFYVLKRSAAFDTLPQSHLVVPSQYIQLTR